MNRRELLKLLGAGGVGGILAFPVARALAQVTTSVQNNKITVEEIDFQTLISPVVSDEEFRYLDGVSSAIQTQLNAKASTAHKDTHKSGGSDEITSSDLLEAISKRLQESSGPTTLTLGSVVDGEYLKRSGTDIIGGTPAGGGSTHYFKYVKHIFAETHSTSWLGTTAGRTYIQPIEVPVQMTFSHVVFALETAGASAYCYAGIYADNSSTPQGGALQRTSATTAISGNKMEVALTSNIQLAAGLYWVFIEIDGVADSNFRSGSPKLTQGQGLLPKNYTRSGGYGAPTDPCPAVTNEYTTPWIALKVASVP